MMQKKRKVLLVLLLFSLLLVTSFASFTPVLAEEDQPRYGGTFMVRHRGNPISFNGFLNYWSTSRDLHQHVYNRLLTLDEDRNLMPDLAQSWEVLDGGKKFVFHLYENVTWHDGYPFTSEDVVWHWETLADPDVLTYVKSKLATMERVYADGPYTVIFEFSEPTQTVLFTYFQSDTYIHPKHIFDGTDFETNPANFAPIGTGPFKVVDFVPESYCIFEANEDYFKGRPYLDRMIYKIIPDETSGLMAFEAGEVDYTAAPNDEIPRLENIDEYELFWSPSTTSHRLTFNFREECIEKYPWVENKNVRQAIAHAINRDLIIDRVHKGLATPCYTSIAEGAGIYHNPNVAESLAYDPELAEQMMDDAGYTRGSDGVRFSFEFITYDRWYAVQASELIKEMLKEVGIEVTLRPVEYTTYVALYEIGEEGLQDYPMTYNHMGTWPPEEIGSWMGSRPAGQMNQGFWSNEEVDALLAQGYAEFDPEARKDIYWEIQEIVADEIPFIYILTTEGASVYRDTFTNMESRLPSGTWKSFNKIWWKLGELPEQESEQEPIDEELEANLETLQSDVDSLKSQISGLNSKISSLETQVANISIPAAPSQTMSYVAVVVAIIAVGIAFYFGTKTKT